MKSGNIAYISNKGRYSSFEYAGNVIRFMTSPRLVRYTQVKKWDDGYLEVMAQYGEREEEEYIDLVPILRNLYIDPKTFLQPIKKVELAHA